jgi:VIT1/CCC1 family predicted Fe2+/Mn2+ transporter
VQRRIATRLAAGTLALAALAGCAQAPVPRQALSAAELAIARALAAGAERHAPVELARAEEKLQAAHAAVRTSANARAHTLAEQALVDAELAEVAAHAAQARATASQLRQRLDEQHRGVAPGGDGA